MDIEVIVPLLRELRYYENHVDVRNYLIKRLSFKGEEEQASKFVDAVMEEYRGLFFKNNIA